MKRKRAKRVIEAISSTLFSLLIIGYIASFIFDIHIWFISDLTVLQFILLIVGGNIVLHGLKKIAEAFEDKQDKDNYSSEYEQWYRWNNSYDYKDQKDDASYKGSVPPPPPPPPNGSFSSYNPYEKDEDYKEQLKQQYKDQKHEYKDFYKDQKQDYKEKRQYNEQDYSYNGDDHYYNNYYEPKSDDVINENTFIGDFKFKDSYWQLKPMNLSAFIGDAHIDLTRANIPVGETRIRMSTFIGDLKVHVPNDPRIGISLQLNAFVGDSRLFDEKRGGLGVSTKMETPHYHECERKIIIQLDSFIGDAKVKRVG